MAVYASTVTLNTPRAIRMWGTGEACISGKVDITNYNSTATEETDITKHFKARTVGGTSLKCALIVGATDNGYILIWEDATGTFKAYRQASAGPAVEASDDTDVGEASFWAHGRIH